MHSLKTQRPHQDLIADLERAWRDPTIRSLMKRSPEAYRTADGLDWARSELLDLMKTDVRAYQSEPIQRALQAIISTSRALEAEGNKPASFSGDGAQSKAWARSVEQERAQVQQEADDELNFGE